MVTQQGPHGFDTGIYSDWLTRVSTGPGTEADFYDCLVVVSVAGHRCCGSHSVEQSSCRIQRPDNQ